MYRVRINDTEEEKELLCQYGLKGSYESGEDVSFYVNTQSGKDYRITSEQVVVHCDAYVADGKSSYCFIMPDQDVFIEITSFSAMLYTGPGSRVIGGPVSKTVGIPGINMADPFGIRRKEESKEVVKEEIASSSENPYSWQGKPRFCTECGASTR